MTTAFQMFLISLRFPLFLFLLPSLSRLLSRLPRVNASVPLCVCRQLVKLILSITRFPIPWLGSNPLYLLSDLTVPYVLPLPQSPHFIYNKIPRGRTILKLDQRELPQWDEGILVSQKPLHCQSL